MSKVLLALLFVARPTIAYPWVPRVAGVDSSLLNAPVHKRQSDQATCPFNPVHPGAAPYNAQYPYTGAQNGLPGTGKGGIQVPAPGDTAHAFTAPGPNDIRGPCPGLNAAANHNFLSHDGITTFAELLDAQQNVYNVGYDLAVFLAALGVALDGDIVTEKLSIGCDATSRTSATGGLLGDELGLNGHNKFEGDTSLTRNDYYLSPTGDDYNFNGTLFANMVATTGGTFGRNQMALYRYQRYQQSVAENGNFYFGPKSLLLFGAASFLYELFPSFGPTGSPNLAVIESFFGAKSDGNGGWTHVPEQIPPNWFSRVSPYNLVDVSTEILALYLEYPVLFGGNAGQGNFDALGSFGAITNGKLPSSTTPADLVCLLYQLGIENVPSSLSNVLTLPLEVLTWITGKLGASNVFGSFGC